VRRPEAPRPFRCPLVSVVAPLGIAVNIGMMLFLAVETWLRLVVWLAVGLVIYFGYGYWRSTVGKEIALGLPGGSLSADGAERLPETGIQKLDGPPGSEGAQEP